MFYTELSIALLCFIGFGRAQNQCATPGEKCVDIRQCSVLDNLIKKPNLSDAEIKLITDSQCGHIFGYPWVCCPLAIPTPRHAAVELPKPGVCGSQIDPRIVGGETARIDDFRWMALIEYTFANGRKGFRCGGILINENYVLTASHCVNGKALTQYHWTLSGVRLGEWDTTEDKDCEEGLCSDPVQNVRVAERIPHEDYNPNSASQENDIALLRLERPVNYTQWIKPICLPTSNDVADKNFDRQQLIVAGWGQADNGQSSDRKMKVGVNGVSLNECNLNNVYRRQGITLTSKQLCAGGVRGKDSCNGDSGGPLMVKHARDSDHIDYYLVGIVSFGPKPCGMRGVPGVYTRVDQHMDWIKANIRP
ncbi:serine protease easter-like [Contarinia nasturtii]|uniref:serine protease easter-like n=1 Tax=Contarinia nasturtii TaxID=265458 RepID=UPI0012D454F4|nr:serine protease easter-like [Contarinia nasturtii]